MQLWNYTFQATLHSLFVGLLSFVFCGGAFLRADGPADVEKLTEHTFSFVTSAIIPAPKSVHLVGSFNGWNKDAMPMENTGNGTFSIKVKLSHGVHFYKFVVDGEKWNNDPASDKELEEDDNFGGRNSAVFIGPDARMLLKPMPNHVETTLIIHNPEDIRDANFTGTMLRVRIRLQTNAIQSVKAHAGPAAAELSKIVKRTNPDAYITGEIWTWAQDAFNGDQFDAVMNYRFADAVQLFFVNREKSTSPSKFNTLLQQLIYNYPLQVALVQQNLLGSHDTDRFASMFVNPDRPYDGVNRVQDNAQNVGYDERKPTDEERKRQLQAVAFQMTFVGAPMIYYGDEAGMWSADDPSNRMPMVWKDLEPYDNPECRFYDDVFSFYQRTIAIRNALPALEIGSFRTLLINDKTDVIAFVREHASEKVFVVLNRSSSRKTMELETGENGLYIDWMNPVQATVVPANAEKVDGRPMLKVVDDAKLLNSVDGKLSIPLDRYGVSVLSLKKSSRLADDRHYDSTYHFAERMT